MARCRIPRQRLKRLRLNPLEYVEEEPEGGWPEPSGQEPVYERTRGDELYDQGWTALSGDRNTEYGHVPTAYVCVAPPEDCAHEWTVRGGNLDTQFVEKPESWMDFSLFDSPWPTPELNGWLLLVNKLGFGQFFSLWNQNPEAAAAWLSQRTPSRKGLEWKFRKYMEGLKPRFDFRSRPLPMWVVEQQIGNQVGRHVADDYDLRALGKKHGWCFGAGSFTPYLKGIVRGNRLYFLPHRRGLIAALVKPDDGVTAGFPFSDELGDWVLTEAKFPQNKPANRVVLGMIDV